MPKSIFLDTCILRSAFISKANGKNWHQELGLSDNFRFFTSQKCVIEMYGILKTSILTDELALYGCSYVSSGKAKNSILSQILGDDAFLDIYWHRNVLEAQAVLDKRAGKEDKHTQKLHLLVQWCMCYERVRSDFDSFLRNEGIEIVLYGDLFSHHEWQAKLEDLAIETLVPKEDLEIVLSAMFVDADIFLTKDDKLVRKSFSLPLEPDVPAFCTLENLPRTLIEQENGFRTYPDTL